MRGILVGLLHPIGCRADFARTSMLQPRCCSRKTFKAGQFLQCHVQLDDGTIRLELGDTFEKPLVQVRVGTELHEGTFRFCIR